LNVICDQISATVTWPEPKIFTFERTSLPAATPAFHNSAFLRLSLQNKERILIGPFFVHILNFRGKLNVFCQLIDGAFIFWENPIFQKMDITQLAPRAACWKP